MGKIRTRDGWSYELTPGDLLWAARMIEGEGGNQAGVLWTMAQRLALVHRSAPHLTFSDLIRAYSQPINPRWQRDGEFCRPGGPRSDTEACDERHLARRERITALRPEDMPDAIDFVQRWARGAVPNNVPKAVHFATPEVIARRINEGSLARVVLTDGNAYASTTRSEAWPAHYVEIDA